METLVVKYIMYIIVMLCCQVSYTASSKVFENRTRFPRFFRLVPIAEDFADGFVAVVKRLEWNRVAVLSYDEDFVFNVNSLCCVYNYRTT